MKLSEILQADFWQANILSCQALEGVSGGSYRVELENQQCFLLRLQSQTFSNLGSYRQFEAELLFSLQTLPFVPSLFYQGEDFLVLHWIEGKVATAWDQPHLQQIAECLQQLHHFSLLHLTDISQLPQIDLIQHIFALLQQLPSEQQGCWLMRLDQMQPFIESECRVIAHHDLHVKNVIIQSDGNISFIDWEYAAWSDPALEIAFMFINNELSEVQQHDLLQYYLKNNPLPLEQQRFKQAIIAYLPWVRLLNRLWLQVRSQQPMNE